MTQEELLMELINFSFTALFKHSASKRKNQVKGYFNEINQIMRHFCM